MMDLNERGLSMLKSLKLRYRQVLTIRNDSRPSIAIHTAAIGHHVTVMESEA